MAKGDNVNVYAFTEPRGQLPNFMSVNEQEGDAQQRIRFTIRQNGMITEVWLPYAAALSLGHALVAKCTPC